MKIFYVLISPSLYEKFLFTGNAFSRYRLFMLSRTGDEKILSLTSRPDYRLAREIMRKTYQITYRCLYGEDSLYSTKTLWVEPYKDSKDYIESVLMSSLKMSFAITGGEDILREELRVHGFKEIVPINTGGYIIK